MRFALIVAAISLLATAGSSVTERSVGNQRFALREGDWFVIDEHDEEWKVAPGRIFIKLTQGATPELALNSPPFSALSLERRLPVANFYRFRFSPESNPIDVLAEAVSSPFVEAAFLDTYIRFLGDAYYDELWHLAEIRAEAGWKVTTGSSDVTIAIIDDGFEYYHEDLAANVWSNPSETPGDSLDNDADSLWYGSPLADDMVGWNFVDHDNDPSPRAIPERPVVHGTAVAGFASATKDNDLGVAGVAGGTPSERPPFVAVRVNSVSDVTDAVEYCWRKGFEIISMSWSNSDTYGLVHALLDSAYVDGAVLVAASGNTPHRLVYPPASYSSVIAVGGVGAGGQEVALSWGPEQELVAPTSKSGSGVPLWTTDNDSSITSYNPEILCACPADNPKYIAYFNGTSAACPQVAAVAALMKSHWPSMSNIEIRQRLQESAIDIGDPGWDERFGYGRVDVYRALTEWGTIEGNVTWSPSDTHDGARCMSGDLTIEPGATLTIMPGMVVRIAAEDDLASGDDTSRIEIKVGGSLAASGTPENPIVFESWIPQATDDWFGIKFESGSSGNSLSNVVIKNAARAVENHAPVTLTDCTITDCGVAIDANAAVTASGTLIADNTDSLTAVDVNAGSPTFTKCTIVNNAGSALGARGSSTPTLDQSVVALNGGPAVRVVSGWAGSATVQNSVLYGNTSASGSLTDAEWQTAGQAVWNENPAFCDEANRDYTLYSFSPAAPGAHFTEGAGARGVECIPAATVSAGPDTLFAIGSDPTVVFACPAGDGARLVVTVDLDDAVVTRDIGASEITLDRASIVDSVLVLDEDQDSTLAASGPAAGSTYITTIEHGEFGGHGMDSVTVLINGVPLSAKAGINIRTPDTKNPSGGPADGIVSAPDFAHFGTSAWSPPKPYSYFHDYSGDGQVTASDLAMFAVHYGHQTTHSPMVPASAVVQSTAGVTLQFIEEYVTATDRRLFVDLDLEGMAGVRTCVLSFQPGLEHLELLNWEQGDLSIGQVLFTPALRNGVPELFFGVMVSESFTGSSGRLGRLTFDVQTNEPLVLDEEAFVLAVGDLLQEGEGGTAVAASMNPVVGRTLNTEVVRVVHNRLEQCFPNPFNPSTTIAYSVKEASKVSITIYDVAGHRVRELVNERRDRGAYQVVWDGRNDNGAPVSSGVYFYKLVAKSFMDTKKMTLLK